MNGKGDKQNTLWKTKGLLWNLSLSLLFLIHTPTHPPPIPSHLFHLEYQPVQVVPPFQMNRKIPLIHQLQEYREGQVSQDTLLAQKTPFHLLKSKPFFIMSAVHTRRQRGAQKALITCPMSQS